MKADQLSARKSSNEEYQKYMGRPDGYAESCTAVFAELFCSLEEKV